MNINPISFQGITKITGNNPFLSANKITRNIRTNNNGNTQAENKIAKQFDVKETKGLATSVTLDYGKNAYVLTGEEYEQFTALQNDFLQRSLLALDKYGKGSFKAKILIESEQDRYMDLAKMLILDRQDSTLNTEYDILTDTITSLDVTM